MENFYTCAVCVHILFFEKNYKTMFTETQRSQKQCLTIDLIFFLGGYKKSEGNWVSQFPGFPLGFLNVSPHRPLIFFYLWRRSAQLFFAKGLKIVSFQCFNCERSQKSCLTSDLLAINVCMTSGTFLKKFGKNMENFYTCAVCVHILFFEKKL